MRLSVWFSFVFLVAAIHCIKSFSSADKNVTSSSANVTPSLPTLLPKITDDTPQNLTLSKPSVEQHQQKHENSTKNSAIVEILKKYGDNNATLSIAKDNLNKTRISITATSLNNSTIDGTLGFNVAAKKQETGDIPKTTAPPPPPPPELTKMALLPPPPPPTGAGTDPALQADAGFDDKTCIPGLTQMVYKDVDGYQVHDLEKSAKYPDKPDETNAIDNINLMPDRFPFDSFGEKIFGYFKPPKDGDYIFNITSNGAADLRISTNQDKSNIRKYAGQTGRQLAKPNEYDKFATQQSIPVQMRAGEIYYLEVVHKSLYGSAHVQVGAIFADKVHHFPIETQFYCTLKDLKKEGEENAAGGGGGGGGGGGAGDNEDGGGDAKGGGGAGDGGGGGGGGGGGDPLQAALDAGFKAGEQNGAQAGSQAGENAGKRAGENAGAQAGAQAGLQAAAKALGVSVEQLEQQKAEREAGKKCGFKIRLYSANFKCSKPAGYICKQALSTIEDNTVMLNPREDAATFLVRRPGLSHKRGTVSFELDAKRGSFLKKDGATIVTAVNDGSKSFGNLATFSLDAQDEFFPGSYGVRLSDNPDIYVCHTSGQPDIVLDQTGRNCAFHMVPLELDLNYLQPTCKNFCIEEDTPPEETDAPKAKPVSPPTELTPAEKKGATVETLHLLDALARHAAMIATERTVEDKSASEEISAMAKAEAESKFKPEIHMSHGKGEELCCDGQVVPGQQYLTVHFKNMVGPAGTIRIKSSIKPEGYLLGSDVFKLKIVFKHHFLPSVSFSGVDESNPSNKILLNGRPEYSVKPSDSRLDFTEILVTGSNGKPDAKDKTPSAKTAEASNNNAKSPEAASNKHVPGNQKDRFPDIVEIAYDHGKSSAESRPTDEKGNITETSSRSTGEDLYAFKRKYGRSRMIDNPIDKIDTMPYHKEEKVANKKAEISSVYNSTVDRKNAVGTNDDRENSSTKAKNLSVSAAKLSSANSTHSNSTGTHHNRNNSTSAKKDTISETVFSDDKDKVASESDSETAASVFPVVDPPEVSALHQYRMMHNQSANLNDTLSSAETDILEYDNLKKEKYLERLEEYDHIRTDEKKEGGIVSGKAEMLQAYNRPSHNESSQPPEAVRNASPEDFAGILQKSSNVTSNIQEQGESGASQIEEKVGLDFLDGRANRKDNTVHLLKKAVTMKNEKVLPSEKETEERSDKNRFDKGDEDGEWKQFSVKNLHNQKSKNNSSVEEFQSEKGENDKTNSKIDKEKEVKSKDENSSIFLVHVNKEDSAETSNKHLSVKVNEKGKVSVKPGDKPFKIKDNENTSSTDSTEKYIKGEDETSLNSKSADKKERKYYDNPKGESHASLKKTDVKVSGGKTSDEKSSGAKVAVSTKSPEAKKSGAKISGAKISGAKTLAKSKIMSVLETLEENSYKAKLKTLDGFLKHYTENDTTQKHRYELWKSRHPILKMQAALFATPVLGYKRSPANFRRPVKPSVLRPAMKREQKYIPYSVKIVRQNTNGPYHHTYLHIAPKLSKAFKGGVWPQPKFARPYQKYNTRGTPLPMRADRRTQFPGVVKGYTRSNLPPRPPLTWMQVYNYKKQQKEKFLRMARRAHVSVPGHFQSVIPWSWYYPVRRIRGLVEEDENLDRSKRSTEGKLINEDEDDTVDRKRRMVNEDEDLVTGETLKREKRDMNGETDNDELNVKTIHKRRRRSIESSVEESSLHHHLGKSNEDAFLDSIKRAIRAIREKNASKKSSKKLKGKRKKRESGPTTGRLVNEDEDIVDEMMNPRESASIQQQRLENLVTHEMEAAEHHFTNSSSPEESVLVLDSAKLLKLLQSTDSRASMIEKAMLVKNTTGEDSSDTVSRSHIPLVNIDTEVANDPLMDGQMKPIVPQKLVKRSAISNENTFSLNQINLLNSTSSENTSFAGNDSLIPLTQLMNSPQARYLIQKHHLSPAEEKHSKVQTKKLKQLNSIRQKDLQENGLLTAQNDSTIGNKDNVAGTNTKDNKYADDYKEEGISEGRQQYKERKQKQGKEPLVVNQFVHFTDSLESDKTQNEQDVKSSHQKAKKPPSIVYPPINHLPHIQLHSSQHKVNYHQQNFTSEEHKTYTSPQSLRKKPESSGALTKHRAETKKKHALTEEEQEAMVMKYFQHELRSVNLETENQRKMKARESPKRRKGSQNSEHSQYLTNKTKYAMKEITPGKSSARQQSQKLKEKPVPENNFVKVVPRKRQPAKDIKNTGKSIQKQQRQQNILTEHEKMHNEMERDSENLSPNMKLKQKIIKVRNKNLQKQKILKMSNSQTIQKQLTSHINLQNKYKPPVSNKPVTKMTKDFQKHPVEKTANAINFMTRPSINPPAVNIRASPPFNLASHYNMRPVSMVNNAALIQEQIKFVKPQSNVSYAEFLRRVAPKTFSPVYPVQRDQFFRQQQPTPAYQPTQWRQAYMQQGVNSARKLLYLKQQRQSASRRNLAVLSQKYMQDRQNRYLAAYLAVFYKKNPQVFQKLNANYFHRTMSPEQYNVYVSKFVEPLNPKLRWRIANYMKAEYFMKNHARLDQLKRARVMPVKTNVQNNNNKMYTNFLQYQNHMPPVVPANQYNPYTPANVYANSGLPSYQSPVANRNAVTSNNPIYTTAWNSRGYTPYYYNQQKRNFKRNFRAKTKKRKQNHVRNNIPSASPKRYVTPVKMVEDDSDSLGDYANYSRRSDVTKSTNVLSKVANSTSIKRADVVSHNNLTIDNDMEPELTDLSLHNNETQQHSGFTLTSGDTSPASNFTSEEDDSSETDALKRDSFSNGNKSLSDNSTTMPEIQLTQIKDNVTMTNNETVTSNHTRHIMPSAKHLSNAATHSDNITSSALTDALSFLKHRHLVLPQGIRKMFEAASYFLTSHRHPSNGTASEGFPESPKNLNSSADVLLKNFSKNDDFKLLENFNKEVSEKDRHKKNTSSFIKSEFDKQKTNVLAMARLEIAKEKLQKETNDVKKKNKTETSKSKSKAIDVTREYNENNHTKEDQTVVVDKVVKEAKDDDVADAKDEKTGGPDVKNSTQFGKARNETDTSEEKQAVVIDVKKEEATEKEGKEGTKENATEKEGQEERKENAAEKEDAEKESKAEDDTEKNADDLSKESEPEFSDKEDVTLINKMNAELNKLNATAEMNSTLEEGSNNKAGHNKVKNSTYLANNSSSMSTSTFLGIKTHSEKQTDLLKDHAGLYEKLNQMRIDAIDRLAYSDPNIFAPPPGQVKQKQHDYDSDYNHDVTAGDWFDSSFRPDDVTKQDLKITKSDFMHSIFAKQKHKSYASLPTNRLNKVDNIVKMAESDEQRELQNLIKESIGHGTTAELGANVGLSNVDKAAIERSRKLLKSEGIDVENHPSSSDKELRKLLGDFKKDFALGEKDADGGLFDDATEKGDVMRQVNAHDQQEVNALREDLAKIDSTKALYPSNETVPTEKSSKYSAEKINQAFDKQALRDEDGIVKDKVFQNADNSEDSKIVQKLATAVTKSPDHMNNKEELEKINRLTEKWKVVRDINKKIAADTDKELRALHSVKHHKSKEHTVFEEPTASSKPLSSTKKNLLEEYFSEVDNKTRNDFNTRQEKRQKKIKATLTMINDIESQIDAIINSTEARKKQTKKGKAAVFKELVEGKTVSKKKRKIDVSEKKEEELEDDDNPPIGKTSSARSEEDRRTTQSSTTKKSTDDSKRPLDIGSMIALRDQSEEQRTARELDDIQKAEANQDMLKLKEITQDGLQSMFASAVAKQQKFMDDIQGVEPAAKQVSSMAPSPVLEPLSPVSSMFYNYPARLVNKATYDDTPTRLVNKPAYDDTSARLVNKPGYDEEDENEEGEEDSNKRNEIQTYAAEPPQIDDVAAGPPENIYIVDDD